MDTLTNWLLSMVVPILSRVLAALGLGTITYTGLSALGAQIEALVVAQWGQVGGDILAIATLGGIPQALGIILGALAARLAFATIARIGKMIA